MNGTGLLVVLATYNEIETLPRLIGDLLARLPSVNILVVDDNSPDGTGKWCEKFTAGNQRVKLVTREKKLGLGTAAIFGFQYAIERGFKLIATMDADLSHAPISLVEMLRLIQVPNSTTPDVVIGSRYVSGGKIVGWPWYRRISSYLVNVYARLLLGLPTRDNTSAFRIYNVDCLRKIDFSKIQSKGYSYLEEILMVLKHQDVSFAEVPIEFHDRELGQSKVDLKELAGSLFQILQLSLRSRKSNIKR